MAGYTKLFGSILDSTVWDTDPSARCVWVTMLAMADRDGIVEASVPGLANRAKVDRVSCEKALALFMAPDPDSRTKDHEGRRIVEHDGGWRLLNFEKYRDRDDAEERRRKDAERQQRRRDRQRSSRDVTIVTQNPPSDQAQAQTRPDQQSKYLAADAAHAHPPVLVSKPPTKPKPVKVPDPNHRPLVDAWDALYRGRTGHGYGWAEKKAHGQVATLLKLAASAPAGPVAEVMRRAAILYTAPPHFLARDTSHDLGTLVANWNKLSEPTQRAGPANGRRGLTDADMREAEIRATMHERGEKP